MSPHPRKCSKAKWATETWLNPFGVLPEESLTLESHVLQILSSANYINISSLWGGSMLLSIGFTPPHMCCDLWQSNFTTEWTKTYILVSDQNLTWEKVHLCYLIWSTGLCLLYQHLTSHTSAGKMWQNDKTVKFSKLVAACEQPYRKDAGRLPPKFSA